MPQRLQGHREGSGCVTTRKAFDQGIGFTLARVWEPGSLRLERPPRPVPAAGPAGPITVQRRVHGRPCGCTSVPYGARLGRYTVRPKMPAWVGPPGSRALLP
jgi:hypothetical protein